MNYKEIFVLKDYTTFNEEVYEVDKFEDFKLNSYPDYYLKLDSEFYLRYFIHKILFSVDILELDHFIDFHYSKSGNQDLFYKVLKLKVVPQITEIIENAQPYIHVTGNHSGKSLGDGFYEYENVIIKKEFDNTTMSKSIGGKSFTAKYFEKLKIIKEFLQIDNIKSEIGKLKWNAGPGKLGYIVRELLDTEYFEFEKYRGEVNSSLLAKELLRVFDVKDCSSWASLSKYLNPNSKKFKQIKSKFDKAELKIPAANFV